MINGKILQIVYDKPGSGGFDDGSTMTVTGESSGTPIWTESAVNADATRLPRTQVCGTTGTALTYDGTRIVAEPVAIANERVKIAVTAGGNVKTGTFYIVVG
jgi:hypothetical protein